MSSVPRRFALITGASRGIGRAVALRLASDGFDIGIGFRTNQEAADAVAEEAKTFGASALLLQADVSEEAEVKSMFKRIDQHTDRINALICSAGQTRDTLLGASEPQDYDTLWATNVQGVVNCCRHAAKRMMQKRSGSIVTLSSVAAQRPGRGQSNYSASKGAIESFTRSLAVELAPRKIRVNAVAPGVIDTDMTRDVRALALDEIQERILMRRVGTATEVANVIAFLTSDQASYVTGQIWNVDGGFKLE